MKNAKLIVDGKEIEVLISEETLEQLTNKRTTGYERVRFGSTYYTDSCGVVKTFEEYTDYSDEEVYESGNYYSDPDVAANNIRADNLMRKLRRFAVENRKDTINWSDDNQDKYYLYYNYDKKDISHLIEIANKYLTDDVSKSICKQYEKKGYITYKQRKCLVYNILHCCEEKPKEYGNITFVQVE